MVWTTLKPVRISKLRLSDWLSQTSNEHQLENFPKGDDKLPFENDNYDMLETWNTICDLVKKGNV